MCERCAQVRGRVVFERLNQGVPLQRLLDYGPLDAPPSAVHDTNVPEPLGMSGSEVLVYHGGDLPRLKRVQI